MPIELSYSIILLNTFYGQNLDDWAVDDRNSWSGGLFTQQPRQAKLA
jgi:hypothetical protein